MKVEHITNWSPSLFINLISWNLQGVGGEKFATNGLRLLQELNFIKESSERRIDILLAQEHHLNRDCCIGFGDILEKDWLCIWAPAQGTNNRKGGLLRAFHKTTNITTMETKILAAGRAIFVSVKWNNMSLSTINIYAYNQEQERSMLWQTLKAQCEALMPTLDGWMFAGDFNMVKKAVDRSGCNTNTIKGMELHHWKNLLGLSSSKTVGTQKVLRN